MRTSAVLAALLALAAGFAADARPAPTGKPKVKLAVLVMFDQMRGDYQEKWRPQFGPDGFVRLQTEGAWFARCYYPYGTTTTGPGHASVLSGTCGDTHGIVNNNWREKGRDVYCAADARYKPVPAPDVDPKDPAAETQDTDGGTPERLLSETVADVLKREYGDAAKVFGLSLKDRSAILPTGRRPDGAFWFVNQFVTSTYYTERVERAVPKWVTAFNDAKPADKWYGKEWTRFRPDLDYAALSGADDAAGEGAGTKQGKVFPHPLTGGLKAVGKEYYRAVANSPFGNELLLDFAKTCIKEEELGKDDVPDLLVVSFSSNDLIGHTWGPDSQEVLDVTLRSDALMADFLKFLDGQVGKGQYALAVCADHGICPLPEVSAKRGTAAKRVDPDTLRAGIEKHLTETFGAKPAEPAPGAKAAPGWIEAVSFPWLYLNPRLVAASGKDRGAVARSLADYLAAHPDIERAYTRADLGRDIPESDAIGKRVKRSFYPDRCGDVCVVLHPYCLYTKPTATGTTHGAPHDYDAHVPLLVYGPGVPGGKRDEAVTPQATAAVFAKFLGVRPPAAADFPVPATLETK